MSIYLSLPAKRRRAVHKAITESKQRVRFRAIFLDLVEGQLSQREIANKYGVSQSMISDVKAGRLGAKWTKDLREAWRAAQGKGGVP